MRKQYCQACSFARHGVKTRIAIPHTCGGNPVPAAPIDHQRIPTQEEMDRYLARLKELMEGESDDGRDR